MTVNKHVWYELMVNKDQEAAEAFYADVVGWTMTDSGMTDMRYTIISAGEGHPIGGVVTLPDVPHFWIGYIGVDDVDAYAAKVKAAGGSVHHGPDDIPNVGRFAVVADPQGAAFVLFKGNGTPDPTPQPYMTPGTIGWHELHSTDWEKAWDFYSGLFGWKKDEAMDMGPMGTYQLFSQGAGAVGAMFNSKDAPQPGWVFYFSVPSIAAAQARLEAGGGKVINGPMEVPGGMWVVNATDPQGTMFALVGPKG